MSRLEKTDESSLSGGFVKLVISAAIKQHHLHESIFHLLKISIRAESGWPFFWTKSFFLLQELELFFHNYLCKLEAVGEEVAEGKVNDAFMIALRDERSHRDDVFRIVVLDVLEASKFALARFFAVDEIGDLDILGLMGSGAYEVDLSNAELAYLYVVA